MMDRIWLAAPSPALRLWAGSGAPVFQLNDAAQAWAERTGSRPPMLLALVQALRDPLQSTRAEHGALRGASHGVSHGASPVFGDPGVEWTAVEIDDGWLVWLHPLAAPAGDRKSVV